MSGFDDLIVHGRRPVTCTVPHHHVDGVPVDYLTVEAHPTDGYAPGEEPPRRQVAGLPRGWHFRVNGGPWRRFYSSGRSTMEITKDMAALLALMHEHGVLEEMA